MSKKNKLIPELRFPEFAKSAGWEVNTLEELSTVIKGEQLNRIELTEKGKYPCQNGGINPSGFTDKFNSEENTITISEGGNSCGYVNFMTSKFWLGGHCYKLKTNKKVDKQFLFQALKHNEEKIMRLRVGSGLPNIQLNAIRSFEFAICNSLSEQKKIASCLSSLDEIITGQTKKLDLLKDHKKGLMQNLFPQVGEKVPKYRFKEFEKEGDWKSMTLGEISKITSGGTPNRSENQYWNGDIPWISTTLINFNIINEANEYITEIGLQNSSAKIFPKGTILMAMYGQGKTRGKVGVLGINAATNQACAAILLKKEYSTDYVFQYLAAHYDEIRELSNKGGQENLSAGLIENIPLSISTNLKEQQKIASCLSSLDDLITLQTEAIEQLKKHKKGLMQGLFPKIEN